MARKPWQEILGMIQAVPEAIGERISNSKVGKLFSKVGKLFPSWKRSSNNYTQGDIMVQRRKGKTTVLSYDVLETDKGNLGMWAPLLPEAQNTQKTAAVEHSAAMKQVVKQINKVRVQAESTEKSMVSVVFAKGHSKGKGRG